MGTLHYHPMLPETTHDEQSRMDFTSTLIRQLDAVIRPQLRTVYSKTVEPNGALLVVEDAEDERESFEARHGVTVDAQPLRLAEMFKVWTGGGAR